MARLFVQVDPEVWMREIAATQQRPFSRAAAVLDLQAHYLHWGDVPSCRSACERWGWSRATAARLIKESGEWCPEWLSGVVERRRAG